MIEAGGPVPQEVREEIARQGIRLEPASLDEPAADVALVGLAPGGSADGLAALVDALHRAGARRLLGWAPAGDGGDAERTLEAGFDDVVAGRSSARELAGRLHALSRRLLERSRAPEAPSRHGRVTVDVRQHRAWIDGVPIGVSRHELLLLATLVAARGQCRTRGELLAAAWRDAGLERSDRAVDNVVLRLRRKLPDPGLIVTVRGVGFRLREG